MELDERGKQCPLPVIDIKKALDSSSDGEIVEVLVDNEITAQNLRKMADHKGFVSSYEKIGDREFHVKIAAKGREAGGAKDFKSQPDEGAVDGPMEKNSPLEDTACQPDSRRKGMVAIISSNPMSQGDETLGGILVKGFVYASTQQDNLSEAVLLYNNGAYLSCEGSDNLEGLKKLEAQGAEILAYGTYLNRYGLGDKLKVGGIANMYEIVERMTGAGLLVRP